MEGMMVNRKEEGRKEKISKGRTKEEKKVNNTH